MTTVTVQLKLSSSLKSRSIRTYLNLRTPKQMLLYYIVVHRYASMRDWWPSNNSLAKVFEKEEREGNARSRLKGEGQGVELAEFKSAFSF